jgi:hypothetical protein
MPQTEKKDLSIAYYYYYYDHKSSKKGKKKEKSEKKGSPKKIKEKKSKKSKKGDYANIFSYHQRPTADYYVEVGKGKGKGKGKGTIFVDAPVDAMPIPHQPTKSPHLQFTKNPSALSTKYPLHPSLKPNPRGSTKGPSGSHSSPTSRPNSYKTGDLAGTPYSSSYTYTGGINGNPVVLLPTEPSPTVPSIILPSPSVPSSTGLPVLTPLPVSFPGQIPGQTTSPGSFTLTPGLPTIPTFTPGTPVEPTVPTLTPLSVTERPSSATSTPTISPTATASFPTEEQALADLFAAINNASLSTGTDIGGNGARYANGGTDSNRPLFFGIMAGSASLLSVIAFVAYREFRQNARKP